MTAREPFVTVRDDSVPNVKCFDIRIREEFIVGGPQKEAINYIAAKINDEFNKRLDEEVKKAVEEFRERAALFIERANIYKLAESGEPLNRPDFLDPNFTVREWLSNEIRKMPKDQET